MKVVSKTITDGETSVEIDLFEGRSLKKRVKDRIRSEVGDFLIEQTLASMSEKRSPVQGAGNFPALSKNYKRRKLDEVGSGEANLEAEGILKDEIDVVPTDNGIALGVFGERAGAADGHCNLSGASQLPRRKFLPDVGERYKSNITREADRIVTDILAEESPFSAKQFKDVTTKKALYEALARVLGDMSRSELSLAVYRNEDLTELLSELDLLRLL